MKVCILQVNDCRKYLFSRKNRMVDSIPPTQAALIQHSLRASLQGGHIWGQCTIADPLLPNTSDFGWVKENSIFKPLWTTLPSAATSCDELISCGCLTACRGLCKCYKANLPCTALCACDGDCYSDSCDGTGVVQEVEEDCEIDNVLDTFFDED